MLGNDILREVQRMATLTPTKQTATPKHRYRAWAVVLHDDDHHTAAYAIYMLQELFAFNIDEATELTKQVAKDGRAGVFEGHLEQAEFKQEQIHGFGRDRSVAECAGAMTATLEPVE